MGMKAKNNVQKIKILLVYSSADTAESVKAALVNTGAEYSMDMATSISEARSWLDENTPDLVIADLILPDGRGTFLLPPDKRNSHFPVLFTVDPDYEVEVVSAIRSGAMDYILNTSTAIAGIPKVVERALRQWGYIVRQRLTEDALRDSEERFRSFFQTAAAGMVVISTYNNIVQVNPAFCTFSGYREEELLGRCMLDVTHPDDRDRVTSMYDDLFSLRTRSIDCERRYLRKDGVIVWGHVSVACVVGSDSRPAFAIALVQDISLRKALEEQLLKTNRELDAFVHTVSHDLRSPLTPIISYVQLILEKHEHELPETVTEMLLEVYKQGERMHRMLEDLLALATVGKMELPSEPVSGEEVLRDIMMRCTSEPHMNTAIICEGIPDMMLPKTLYLQILDNLVGNALQYAPGKPVEITGQRSGSTVRLMVRDYGAGVPDDEKAQIFGIFNRGTAGKEVPGTGIGLATVQKIAKKYDGTAWVEDAPGGGSIFNVELKGV